MSSEKETEEIPQTIREQFKYEPIYCRDCELPVSLTIDNDDTQPQRYECSCKVRAPASAFPDCWVVP